ncbi:phosphate ABC transporter substrate-binding protein [Okeania sp.]|uniref:phosphate ABC transporter substrate-binding protein n=1 Tax=Okeania sp. TaxID=3100323 RepID=UPI002B4B82FF|nr:phosphate ABC transporter substrate-binding protein [Okeania sp.]MEB3339552.1 phosphate ABC transporter substrate-binding protein [Okeania sp.]
MAKRSGPPPIVFILAFLLIAGGGYWFWKNKQSGQTANNTQPAETQTTTQSAETQTTTTTTTNAFTLPTNVPSGTVVRVDGSTSMVTINQNLKAGFEKQFPNTTVATSARGSGAGIKDLLAGNLDVAASSRPLTAEEQGQGLEAVPVALDKIAIVVGINNPFNGSLTPNQVKAIFQGQITNWSDVGGPNAQIRVINRPTVSGTHQSFQEMVLNGESFGNSANITTLERDATTPLLRALENDGIGYATFAQVQNQQTVRSLPINSLNPDSATYPLSRQLFYVYKNPPTQAAKDFLGYATSSQGQEAVFED